ncbi:MAG TPA: NAD(P)-binding domain-containing protein [Actinomycetota bacterium]|nr:NAD(P)-binding domain-containing protein [Actinomycetota bacterium]
MRVGVLGTGSVGRAIGGKLAELGHDVMLGTRDVGATMRRPDGEREDESFTEWLGRNPEVAVGTFAQAGAHGEVIFNCTLGDGSLDTLGSAGEHLEDKVLVDVSNPLVFAEEGMSLFVPSTDSLAERIQRAHPRTKVVKALNTVNARVMVDPATLGGGDHTIFVCGDDEGAKGAVTETLRAFGWEQIIDLGDLSAARGMEAYLLLWGRLMGALGSPALNVKIVT